MLVGKIKTTQKQKMGGSDQCATRASLYQLVYKKPEEYDLNHVTELRLNPGPVNT